MFPTSTQQYTNFHSNKNIPLNNNKPGCLFDLLGGSPAYGFAPSAAVVLLGGPLSIFLFVSAIAKGKKETEEDDEAFKKSGGGML